MKTLEAWLSKLESIHPTSIDLTLSRVDKVFNRLQIDFSKQTVITIAGTNGKGSCVNYLDAMLTRMGLKTGVYTSPHLLQYNERIKIQQQTISDSNLCRVFTEIEKVRENTTLTYFEFGTLAALKLFNEADLDVVILEVGLGGRLDAVNVVDSDIALITSIGYDHTEWLGDSLESIAKEKAGIFRAGKPAVFAERNLQQTLLQLANAQNTNLYCVGREYDYVIDSAQWRWNTINGAIVYENLPYPVMPGHHQIQNMAACLMVITLLNKMMLVNKNIISQSLTETSIPGRIQPASYQGYSVLIDVSHNEAAMNALVKTIKNNKHGKIYIIFGLLKDKSLNKIVEILKTTVHRWHLVTIHHQRGYSADQLKQHLLAFDPDFSAQCHETVDEALQVIYPSLAKNDQIIICGSFYLAAEAIQQLSP